MSNAPYRIVADLKARRRAVGTSQVALAVKAGVSQTTVWRAERGLILQRANAEAIEAALRALGEVARPQ